MRVLVFGDSITQGFWDTEGGWVARLRKYYDERQLRDLFNNDEPAIFNLGISGDVTEGVIKRFSNELEARRWRWPDEQFCLVFAIGTNDSITENAKHRSRPENYGQQLLQLISDAKTKAEKIIFIGLTPVDESTANGRPGKPKKYSNERIVAYDNELEKVCNETGTNYLKLFDAVKRQMDEGRQLFDDGLHPNDAGHQFIYELIRPELDKLVQ